MAAAQGLATVGNSPALAAPRPLLHRPTSGLLQLLARPAAAGQLSSPGWLGSHAGSCAPQPARAAAVRTSAARIEPPAPPPAKRLSVDPSPEVADAHLMFDEVVVVVKSGNGGNGEVVPAGRGRWVSNHKYKPGRNQAKQIWLPASEPGDGADGGDVVLVCDPSLTSLLHLHPPSAGGASAAGGPGGPGRARAGPGGASAARRVLAARDGSSANPNTGSGGPKRNKDIKKALTPALEIPVPPGTVVKRRGSGALVGELLQPGERLVVVRGGEGGRGVMAPSKQGAGAPRRGREAKEAKQAAAKGVEVVEATDEAWRSDARGRPGQQVSLWLLLRVAADVGLVGLPNAGKSSLLKALTRATPAIASFPFTTLIPNLGVMQGGQGQGGQAGPRGDEGPRPVLADLPGLIEGAHKGRGLGRTFLRHLRRTRAVLHVLDGAAGDPAGDYFAVREELRMYNPDYVARPHVVALNKADLLREGAGAEGAEKRMEELVAAVRAAATRQAAEHGAQGWEGPAPRPPLEVVVCSAASGEGLEQLSAALQRALRAQDRPGPAQAQAQTRVQARRADAPAEARRSAAAVAPAAASRQAVATTPAAAAPAASAGSSSDDAASTSGGGSGGGGLAAILARRAAAKAAGTLRTDGPPPPPPPGWDEGLTVPSRAARTVRSGPAMGAGVAVPLAAALTAAAAAAASSSGGTGSASALAAAVSEAAAAGDVGSEAAIAAAAAAPGNEALAAALAAAAAAGGAGNEAAVAAAFAAAAAADPDGISTEDEEAGHGWSAWEEGELGSPSASGGEEPDSELEAQARAGGAVRLASAAVAAAARGAAGASAAAGMEGAAGEFDDEEDGEWVEVEEGEWEEWEEGADGAEAAGGDEEGLVAMAPSDDPDAALLGLSTEELLAREAEW
ncbi:hypothetical protein HYH03_013555 [Edaphochlamys debaryana]|uniref:Uncharacterized protein n=1 Tax=Edaphochlamys debaryana TaxID=47281 RepID=A0A835XRX7_9CHLO|nr:hypothetical protein HYH03_013555 [Edaphochlamys debaryana]|eukprot:KAG2487838.1 hypothetical protein HYH03_013555 [Edaphochlamys debaryana]